MNTLARVALLVLLALLAAFPVPVLAVTGTGAALVTLAAGRHAVRELRGRWWLVTVQRPGLLAATAGTS
ncbi:hypothetical protein [Actinomadura formosensis]|uniref:hypothetical protein n=1 Tax=Actinomadura formosensis TaxID=60706 RepID=UPI001041A65F|nr:hypothetical protein [Actinomadura formosensis]